MGNNVVYYSSVKNLAELCKGSTADSDSVCLGSNPSSAAKKSDKFRLVGFFYPSRRLGISSRVSVHLFCGLMIYNTSC